MFKTEAEKRAYRVGLIAGRKSNRITEREWYLSECKRVGKKPNPILLADCSDSKLIEN